MAGPGPTLGCRGAGTHTHRVSMASGRSTRNLGAAAKPGPRVALPGSGAGEASAAEGPLLLSPGACRSTAPRPRIYFRKSSLAAGAGLECWFQHSSASHIHPLGPGTEGSAALVTQLRLTRPAPPSRQRCPRDSGPRAWAWSSGLLTTHCSPLPSHRRPPRPDNP